MTRPALATPFYASIFALFLAGCGADDGTATETPEGPQLKVACQTSLPTADELSGPLVLGFMHPDPSELIVLDAQVDIAEDSSELQITIDGPERCGPAQHFEPLPLNADGTFSATDITLKFPRGINDDRAEEALVDFSGGFCSSVGSLQGSYTGTSLTQEATPIEGAWFIARVTDAASIKHTCAAVGE
ncbi:MAG: hypothetical protein H6718_20025 [Polyangiaceae bacterium]|nr:hypothetical protein [Myxococcales bacterium]MCB9587701.1 hypothetical protein [Polyangiaceae bacterium]MCB9605501.1 hypothetical protein [Polyangiaceae bacterium]